MTELSLYAYLIITSLVIIASFIFNEVSKKTNIPSVLLLIALGVVLQYALQGTDFNADGLNPILKTLGTVGLIMIVLEAALELELDRNKLVPITKALLVALVGLVLSAWIGALILQYFIPSMSTIDSWIYSTPISILSSAIIIPSVNGLRPDKKEFHIYESTFSDIIGIMLFYFLTENLLPDIDGNPGKGVSAFGYNVVITVLISFVASYLILLIFQRIKSNVKLFLLISVLILLYAVAKEYHLSSLLIILVFGLMTANVDKFFVGPMKKYLNKDTTKAIYNDLHFITMETAFVIRTLFFVVFGLSISLMSLANGTVVLISLCILLSIFVIRFIILRLFVGKDIMPQLFIAPRGLITILLFYDIPDRIKAANPGFNNGILLFIIISTGVIMTLALIADKRKANEKISQLKSNDVGYSTASISDVSPDDNVSPMY